MSLSDTQEQILDAALQMIVRDDLDSTSMRAVAEEAEVSLGLLSYHFDGKEKLIVAAFRRAADRLTAHSAALIAEAGDDPRRQVRAALRACFDPEFSDLEHLEIWVTIWAVGRTNDDVAAAERDLYAQWADVLCDAISEAQPALSPDAVSRQVTDAVALKNGLWINWNRWGNREAPERGLRRCETIASGEFE